MKIKEKDIPLKHSFKKPITKIKMGSRHITYRDLHMKSRINFLGMVAIVAIIAVVLAILWFTGCVFLSIAK